MNEIKEIDPPSKHGAAICPGCGEYVEYLGIHDFDDDCLYWPWTCKCGLRGKECHEVLFSHHEIIGDTKVEVQHEKTQKT
ncbi:MAG: hypothetical protein HZA50_13840 [Planctomycetes bacterium]|nr:hypothetical protein [Planctomycetota bacterium]